MTVPVHEPSSGFDPAWRDIEQLVAQIDELSKSRMRFRDFAKELVARTVRALGAAGGAVWLNDAQGKLVPVYEVALWSATGGDLESHRRLAEAFLRESSPDHDLSQREPSDRQESVYHQDLLLLFAPIRTEQGVVGAIELARSPTENATVVRGHLRLLGVLSELAAQYLTRAELHKLRHSRLMWQHFRQFAREIHRSLELQATAYRIANEGKRFLGYDRVSVLVPSGRRARLLAVSGLDTIDRRANAVRSLENFATVVMKADETVRYDGQQMEVAPEIQQPLQQHLDQSRARTLVALPLRIATSDSDDFSQLEVTDVVGVLVVERFDADTDPTTEDRLDLMASQSAIALQNAQGLHNHPVLAFLGGWLPHRRSSSGWRLSKLIGALILLLTLGLAGIGIPVPFDVSAPGELQPRQRRDVFAPVDAEIAELYFQHDDAVRAGQELFALKSPRLELELQQVQGEYETTRKRLWAVETARLQSSPDDESSPFQSAAEQEELRQRLATHQAQLSLLQEEIKKLKVRSPIDGHIVTWDVETLLKNRPVQRGQVLMSVGNVDGPWIAELEVPDDRIGYLLEAQRDSSAPLDVSFELAARRGVTHIGQVAEVASRTDINEDGKATVLVTVVFDAERVAELRSGTTISARIHCGQRSLAFVWLHDLIEVSQEWLFF